MITCIPDDLQACLPSIMKPQPRKHDLNSLDFISVRFGVIFVLPTDVQVFTIHMVSLQLIIIKSSPYIQILHLRLILFMSSFFFISTLHMVLLYRIITNSSPHIQILQLILFLSISRFCFTFNYTSQPDVYRFQLVSFLSVLVFSFPGHQRSLLLAFSCSPLPSYPGRNT